VSGYVHESARGHVTGEAIYTDDAIARHPGLLHAWPVLAPHAHARVTSLDAAPALDEPGVVTVLTGSDVPGEGDSGANRHDEPLFPSEVMFFNQPARPPVGRGAACPPRTPSRLLTPNWSRQASAQRS